MKVTVDTNILIRSIVRDDEPQARAADQVLRGATLIAVTLPTLCEFVWVLRSVYSLSHPDIAAAVQTLLTTANVVCNRPAAEAALVLLAAGGDFADGIIAHEGAWLGADTFVSFDREAVALLKKLGHSTRLLRAAG